MQDNFTMKVCILLHISNRVKRFQLHILQYVNSIHLHMGRVGGRRNSAFMTWSY